MKKTPLVVLLHATEIYVQRDGGEKEEVNKFNTKRIDINTEVVVELIFSLTEKVELRSQRCKGK